MGKSEVLWWFVIGILSFLCLEEELSQKRRKMRQNLDEQMALQEERAKEARLHDLLEGAEVKAQSRDMKKQDMKELHLKYQLHK